MKPDDLKAMGPLTGSSQDDSLQVKEKAAVDQERFEGREVDRMRNLSILLLGILGGLSGILFGAGELLFEIIFWGHIQGS